MNTTIVSVAGALFSGEGKLLLLRTVSAPEQQGEWELPSGPLEFGEEPEIGMSRVFSELAGVDVVPNRPLGAWSTLDAEADTPIHCVTIGYTVTLTGALLSVEVDPRKHSGFAWINSDELAKRIEQPPMRKACERAFQLLARTRKNN